ncbi:MAG: fumarylacetoacetase [Planctomycetota bacterium]|jgi:fumarylacetoacetase
MNRTHDPSLASWIESANDPASDFPIQNLPFGVFRRAGEDAGGRIGVAIGDFVLDVHGCVAEGLLERLGPACACALSASSLNDLMRLGAEHWGAARAAISDLLAADEPRLRDDAERRGRLLVSRAEAVMALPAVVGDYTDFYASIDHATNVGSMFRPDNPLLPNYRHLPVGYHGRASSLVVSGTPVRRPRGQTVPAGAAEPIFGPCRLLDYELEMGAFIGPGNPLGERIPVDRAPDHLFGLCILNDWSARDVQKWEYQPLGPFNAKNFASTISPWVVTLEALAPFRVPGPPRGADHPPMLEYLRPTDDLGLDITVEVRLASAAMRERGLEPVRVSRANVRNLYWTVGQMVAHHTSTGCNLRAGDLLGTGTVSGPTEGERGCLLELTWRGEHPVELPDGTQRTFLQDGDEVIISAFCERDGARRIGFGDCRGVIEPTA